METNNLSYIFSKQQKIANKIFSFCSARDLVRLSKTCKSARKALKALSLHAYLTSRKSFKAISFKLSPPGRHPLLYNLAAVKRAENARDGTFLVGLVRSKQQGLLKFQLETEHGPNRDLREALKAAVTENDLIATQLILQATVPYQGQSAFFKTVCYYIPWAVTYLTKVKGYPKIWQFSSSDSDSDDDVQIISYKPPEEDLFGNRAKEIPEYPHIFPELDSQRQAKKKKLKEAALAGNLTLVKHYLDQEVHPYAKFGNETIVSLLIQKKPKNYLKILSACLQTESSEQYDLVKALWYAMSTNDLQAFTAILQSDLLDSHELSAILWKATHVNLEVLIPWLLEQGANPHAKNYAFRSLQISPYELATELKRENILKLFPNPKKRSTNGEESPAKRVKLTEKE